MEVNLKPDGKLVRGVYGVHYLRRTLCVADKVYLTALGLELVA